MFLFSINKIHFLLIFLLLAISCSKPISHSTLQPNIIFVLTDDMAHGELGINGNTIIKTPHIDKFSKDCLQFTNYNVAPTCAPSRAQIMTGRHEFYAGITHTICNRENLNENIILLPQHLKNAGYQTAMFGKWHLASKNNVKLAPHNRGFDTAIYTYNQLKRFDPVLSHNGQIKKYKGYCVDVVFEQFTKWVDNTINDKSPYFAYIATSAPHTPLAAPQKYIDLYKNTSLTEKQQIYYGMISNIDDNMGKLLHWLDNKKKCARETIVIFMTDNGHAISGPAGAGHDKYGFLTQGGLYNDGQRGGKTQSWRGSVRVPFLLRWPKIVTKGKKNKVLSSGIDILPTLTDIAGIAVEDPDIQGVSLLHNILGKGNNVSEDRLLYSHVGRWKSSEFLNDYKYVYASVFSKQYRLTWNKGQHPELYNYINDPGETTDITEQHPLLVQKMKNAYDQWWENSKKYMINDLKQIKKGEFHVQKNIQGKPSVWRQQELNFRQERNNK